MTLAGIRPGDVVECDVRGDRFFGIVRDTTTAKQERSVRPIGVREAFPRLVTARQIVGHYRKSRRSR